MGLLKPFDPEEIDEVLDDVVSIEDEAMGKPAAEIDVKKIFDSQGATIERAAKTAAAVMQFGDNDNNKLKAAELALKVQGVYKEEKQKSVPDIQINIISNGGAQKTLVNLVMPQVN